VGAVAFVSVVVGIVAYVLRDARERQEQDRCERLTAQLNEAVGSLESGDFVKADAALSELARKLPNEPAAVRNLAICRVLAFLAPRKPGEPEASPEPAQSALDAARNLEPRSPVPHILAARMAHRPEDAATSINALEEAARLAPKAGPRWSTSLIR
jgi:uncharacterized protein HemY